ncbi:MAG TPA: hypothetical protein VKR21_15815 [Solirubrobacteraceae bacterium]|nr:hypothetical protein [Solirubrobacteraceae bacterium]
MPALAVAPIELGQAHAERLDDVIVQLWEELAEDREVACPVCGGEMEPVYSARSQPVGGRCKHCGALLG